MYNKNPGGSLAQQPITANGKKTASSMTREKAQGGSWTWFFVKFVLFGLALTGAYVGYTVYRAKQRDRF